MTGNLEVGILALNDRSEGPQALIPTEWQGASVFEVLSQGTQQNGPQKTNQGRMRGVCMCLLVCALFGRYYLASANPAVDRAN